MSCNYERFRVFKVGYIPPADFQNVLSQLSNSTMLKTTQLYDAPLGPGAILFLGYHKPEDVRIIKLSNDERRNLIKRIKSHYLYK